MHNNMITFFLITTGNDQAVIDAEVLCADFLVEHNLPLAVAMSGAYAILWATTNYINEQILFTELHGLQQLQSKFWKLSKRPSFRLAMTPHRAWNLEVRCARQCSSFFETNVGSSASFGCGRPGGQLSAGACRQTDSARSSSACRQGPSPPTTNLLLLVCAIRQYSYIQSIVLEPCPYIIVQIH